MCMYIYINKFVSFTLLLWNVISYFESTTYITNIWHLRPVKYIKFKKRMLSGNDKEHPQYRWSIGR